MFSSIGRVGFVVLSGVFAVACAGAESGASGAQGSSALMAVAPEPAGHNCANGGQAMSYGVDGDGDGKLDESEVDGTSFVCNGATGSEGAPGTTGAAAAKGDKGDVGATGAQGEQGDKGATGAPGIQGQTGLAGADGQNGATGAAGANGVDGTNGTNGTNGKDGVNGKDAPVVLLGQFLANQVVAGMVVTCTTTNVGASTVECRGMKVNGLDVYLGPKEAGTLCNGVTGNGYSSASGLGVVPAPWLSLNKDSKWTIASAGNASPLQNLTCTK